MLAAVPPVLLLALGVIVVRREFQRSRYDLVRALTSELSLSLGATITVEDVDAGIPGQLVIRGLVLSKPGLGELLRAERATAFYSVSALAGNLSSPASAVSAIVLDKPHLFLERSREGKLNILELFLARPAGEKPFAGWIEMRSGTVRYIDRKPLSGVSQPMAVVVRGVDGTLDLSAPGRPFTARAASTTVSGRVSARGAFDRRDRLVLNAHARDLSLPFLDRFLIAGNDVGLYAGQATGQVLVTRDSGESPHFWVKGRVRGVHVKPPGGLPALTELSGQVSSSATDAVGFSGSARVAGGLWRFAGKAVQLARPVVWVDASSRSVDYARLASLAPRRQTSGVSASGRGPAEVRVRGSLGSPAVSGSAAVPRLAYRGYRLADVRAKFDYSDGRIVLPAVSAVAGGGRIAGFGTVLLGPRPSVTGQVRFSNMSLAALNPRIRGVVWGEAVLSVDGAGQAGRVVFQGRNLEGYGRQVTSAVGDVRLAGSKALVDSLLVATPQGFATASGSVDFGAGKSASLNLDVYGAGITVRDILGAAAAEANASGIFDGEGRVTGPAASPVFQGRVQAINVAWQDRSADYAAGELHVSKSRISSSGLTIIRGGSEVTVRGDILQPLSPQRRFGLSASVKSLHLQEMSTFIPALASVRGDVSGEISRVSGTSRSLNVDFNLSAENLRYRAYTVPSASVQGGYADGELTIASLIARRGPAELSAAGSLRRQGALDFDFRLTGLPIEDVLAMAGQPAPVTGSLGLKGHLGGTTPEPVLSARASLENLNLAGEQIASATAGVDWANDVLNVGGASLQLAGGVVAVDEFRVSTDPDLPGILSASVRLGPGAGRGESGAGEGRLDLSRALVMARSLGLAGRIADPRIREVAFSAPERVAGSLAGDIRLTATESGLTSESNLRIAGLEVWGTPLGAAVFDIATGPDGYHLKDMHLEDGEMVVSATAALTAGDAIAADVEANNFDLRRIRGLPSLAGATGKLDISFTAAGTVASPDIVGSILVADGRIGSVEFERFETGKITADADSVDLAETTIASGDHRVRISGTVPFSVARMAFVEGGKVDARAWLVQPDLDILTLLSPRFDPERTGGEAVAEVAVLGTWPRPQLEGTVQVRDGSIALKGAQTVFRGVNVKVQLDGPRVTIDEFSMPSSDGGVLTVTGGADLRPEGWVLDNVKAQAQDLGLRFKNLTASYGEAYNGKVDVDLEASGRLAATKITGTVTAHSGTVGLPTTAEPGREAPRYPIDPVFDVKLVARSGLKARGPRLNVGVRGQAQLARTLNAPVLSGHLEVTDGYMLFPGSRFRVVPVGSLDFRFAPPEVARVSLDIRAETNLTAVAGNAMRRGISSYRVEMALRGSLENPRVTFQSYPPGLEPSGILAMLGQQAGVGPSGFGAGGDFEREVAQLFTANIAPGVLQPVESALAEALGLQEVAIGLGGLSDDLSIHVRRRLFDGVNLIYWRALAAGQEQDEWKLTYDVTERLRLMYGESRFRARTFGIEGSLSF